MDVVGDDTPIGMTLAFGVGDGKGRMQQYKESQ